MIMSRITLRRSLSALREVSNTALANPYYHHRLIWKLFSRSPQQPRDFLFRIDHHANWLQYYVVSEHPPDAAGNSWEVVTKSYTPALKESMRLRFLLTANPVTTTTDDNGRRHRNDVVRHALRRHRDKKRAALRSDLTTNEGHAWLKRKGEKNGFSFTRDEVVVSGYRQLRFQKTRNAGTVQISTLDFRGTLLVRSPERFLRMLFTGLGPAKAFGCGLMLVKPA